MYTIATFNFHLTCIQQTMSLVTSRLTAAQHVYALDGFFWQQQCGPALSVIMSARRAASVG
jgi:hypothetical protein